MDSKRARLTLAGNLRALMNRPGRTPITEQQLSKQARRAGETLSQSSINRILRGEVSCGIDHLEALASLFDLEPWQLLVGELDPDDPPVLASVSKRLEEFQSTLKRQSEELELLRRQLKPGR